MHSINGIGTTLHGVSLKRFSLTTQYAIEKVPLNMPQVLPTYVYTGTCLCEFKRNLREKSVIIIVFFISLSFQAA